MNKLFSIFSLGVMLALTGCGGGGGGGGLTPGGGGGGGGPVSGYNGLQGGTHGRSIGLAAYDNLADISSANASAVANSANISVSRAAPTELYRHDDGGGYERVLLTDDGYQIEVSAGYDEPAFVRKVDFKTFKDVNSAALYKEITGREPNDFTGYNISAEVHVTDRVSGFGDGGQLYDGVFTVLDMIALGGTHVGLEHSEFGAWITHEYMDGKIDGAAYQGQTNEELAAFAFGDNTKKASFTGSGTGVQSFRGNALAVVYDDVHSIDGNINVFGTAQLDVDLSDLSNTELKLAFANFYNFTISGLLINPGGDIQGYGSSVTAVDTGNTSGIAFSPNFGGVLNEGAWVGAQFYGNTPTSPSEATGQFAIQDHGSYVEGAFGVKR